MSKEVAGSGISAAGRLLHGFCCKTILQSDCCKANSAAARHTARTGTGGVQRASQTNHGKLSEDPTYYDAGKEPQKKDEVSRPSEYRLIPMGTDYPEEDAVNVLDLIRTVRDNWWLVRRITAVFLFLGLLLALFSPVEYQSQALLMPEMKDSEGGASEVLQQYGGLLGMSGLGAAANMTDEGTIPPEVYPQIVQSLSFQYEMLQHPVTFSDMDSTVTVFYYFDRLYTPSILELFLDYTVGLPGKISRALSDDTLPEWVRQRMAEEGLQKLTYDEWVVIRELRHRLDVELETDTGVLKVDAEMPDPVASASVGKKAVTLLTEYLKEYRTQKAQNDLEFAELQFEQARKNFEEAQDRLTEYQERNVSARAPERRMQAEFDLAYDVYSSVSQKRVEAQMKVQEQTPVFKELQGMHVPIENSKPRRVLILFVSLILGLIVSFLYLGGRQVYHDIRAKL